MNFSNEIYNAIYAYVTTDKINFSMFWSFILTFFLFCFNISFVFAIEGGICITILQVCLCFISLVPIFFYPFVVIFHVDKNKSNNEKGFFISLGKNACKRVPYLDLMVQIMVICFIFMIPHVFMLIVYLTSVSFFYDSKSTTFLVLYFTSSSVILWIANAIVIYHISPCLCRCQCTSSEPNDNGMDQAAQKSVKYAKLEHFRYILFAIFLGLSLNLMNFSVIPFIGEFFYDTRANGATVFAIIPLVITILGWYLSGDLVKLFTILSVKEQLKKRKKKTLQINEPENITEEHETIPHDSNNTTMTAEHINMGSKLPNLKRLILLFGGHWPADDDRHRSRPTMRRAGESMPVLNHRISRDHTASISRRSFTYSMGSTSEVHTNHQRDDKSGNHAPIPELIENSV